MTNEKNNSGKNRVKRFINLDWDAIAGIIAAVLALVLHLLHIIDIDVLTVIAVVLLALLFIRDIRRERDDESLYAEVAESANKIKELCANIKTPDILLSGPKKLRKDSEDFCRRAQGEMTWFHVCLLMFKPQSLYDSLLRPAIENPAVSSIQFILDDSQKKLWDEEVLPKINETRGREKVKAPVWTRVDESVSLIISDSGASGETECLLSFWGDPFMSHHAGRNIPRYVLLVKGHSELISHLMELARKYRLTQDEITRGYY